MLEKVVLGAFFIDENIWSMERNLSESMLSAFEIPSSWSLIRCIRFRFLASCEVINYDFAVLSTS